MSGGRPRRANDEICPRCGKPGYSYPVPSWNSPYSDAPRNRYLRFIHEDRNSQYCYIDNLLVENSVPLQVGSEYNKEPNEVTIFRYRPEEQRPEDVLYQWKRTKALPIIIYSFSYIPKKMESEIAKLRKLKKYRLSKKELNWLLEQNGYDYLKDVSRNDIVTFGEEAVKMRDKICQSDSWLGNISEESDRHGMFSEILETRAKNQAVRNTRIRVMHGPSKSQG
jgi:hypothetical protein